MTTVNKLIEWLMGSDQPQEEPLLDKMKALNKSISEVQKYELLTTNQYLQQMDIIVSILHDIQVQMDNNA
jgi:hypothetical protein